MVLERVARLFLRRARARILGIRFQRAACFQLPEHIQLAGQWRPLSLPAESGARVASLTSCSTTATGCADLLDLADDDGGTWQAIGKRWGESG
jgi:hypothetical protein